MKEVFEIYGPAIGPTVAFLLGILALFVKFRVDNYLDKTTRLEKLEQLKQLIRAAPPPSYYSPVPLEEREESPDSFKPKSVDKRLFEEYQSRNIANVGRFYNRLLTTKVLIDNMTEQINHHGEESEIRQFNTIKWWHDNLFKQVEDLTEIGKPIDAAESMELYVNAFWRLDFLYEGMLEACDNPYQLFSYIDPP
jgi:hypothetical protein